MKQNKVRQLSKSIIKVGKTRAKQGAQKVIHINENTARNMKKWPFEEMFRVYACPKQEGGIRDIGYSGVFNSGQRKNIAPLDLLAVLSICSGKTRLEHSSGC